MPGVGVVVGGPSAGRGGGICRLAPSRAPRAGAAVRVGGLPQVVLKVAQCAGRRTVGQRPGRAGRPRSLVLEGASRRERGLAFLTWACWQREQRASFPLVPGVSLLQRLRVYFPGCRSGLCVWGNSLFQIPVFSLGAAVRVDGVGGCARDKQPRFRLRTFTSWSTALPTHPCVGFVREGRLRAGPGGGKAWEEDFFKILVC